MPRPLTDDERHEIREIVDELREVLTVLSVEGRARSGDYSADEAVAFLAGCDPQSPAACGAGFTVAHPSSIPGWRGTVETDSEGSPLLPVRVTWSAHVDIVPYADGLEEASEKLHELLVAVVRSGIGTLVELRARMAHDELPVEQFPLAGLPLSDLVGPDGPDDRRRTA